jgi:hypothetical protein
MRGMRCIVVSGGIFETILGNAVCVNCNGPIALVPVLGWVHVSFMDDLDCEGANAN